MSKRRKSQLWKALTSTYKSARRLAVAIVGASVVLVGIAMLVLPGPAFVVIPTGLAILGLEFAWARRWLATVKEQTQNGINRLRNNGFARNGVARKSESPPASDDSASRFDSHDGDDDQSSTNLRA